MEAKVVLDFSSVVWNENHFQDDAALHYKLASEVVMFIQAFESCNNLKFIARTELLKNVMGLFPYNITNRPDLSDFKRRAQHFLSNRFSDFVSYDKDDDSTINSIPNIYYNYFSDALKVEISYLLAEIHNSANNYIFCTFSTRWQNNDNLKTTNHSTKEHDTIVHKKGKYTIYDFYLNKFRNIFEHNPKHDKLKGKRIENGAWVYPLTCFDGEDTFFPQNLLDSAIQYGDDLYNFDDVNQTFVCFKNHLDNKFHGYDEDIKNVPHKIREEFHK
ncbi:MAG: hypothetical protein LBQ39_01470 [Tannerellaceae bacterium]|jgi:hypothetical protein|nr:hypothetical protein [Tannerellaceae bacterium]